MGCLVVTCREVELIIGNVSHERIWSHTGCMDLEIRRTKRAFSKQVTTSGGGAEDSPCRFSDDSCESIGGPVPGSVLEFGELISSFPSFPLVRQSAERSVRTQRVKTKSVELNR